MGEGVTMPTFQEMRDAAWHAVGMVLLGASAFVGAVTVGIWLGETYFSPRTPRPQISAEPPRPEAPRAEVMHAYPQCPALPPSCHLDERLVCACVRPPNESLVKCEWRCEVQP